MPKLLIIADDLTGAMDTGAQFAKQEIPTRVKPNSEIDAEIFNPEFSVAVINTDSRHVAPAEAAQRVAAAVQTGVRGGAEFFYKKIDSTFRGNVGAELEALLTNSGRAKLAFIPAFPKAQRTTRDGIQYYKGQPIHETSFGRDLLNPMRDSYIPSILRQQTALQMFLINRTGLMNIDMSNEPTIYVFDAESDTDLRRIGLQLQQHDMLHVVAGSAGFAEHLAKLIPFEKHSPVPIRYSKQFLVVNGSINPVSLEQTERAAMCGFKIVSLSPEILVPQHGVEWPAAREIVAKVSGMLGRQSAVALQSIRQNEELEAYRVIGERLRLSSKALAARVAENLAWLTVKIIERTRLNQLAVFGGDTLMAIVRAMKWTTLLPRNEILPGLVVSSVADNEPFVLITKSGGFGDKLVLQELKEFLTRAA